MKRLAGLACATFLAVLAPSQAADGVKPRAAEVTPNAGATFEIIYLVPGVRDDGGIFGGGIATLVLCTNLATTSQQIRFVERQSDASVKANKTFALPGLHTFVAATHYAGSYRVDGTLSPAIEINEGSVVVSATTNAVFCTAMTIGGSSYPPSFGVELHAVRFNPFAGSVE